MNYTQQRQAFYSKFPHFFPDFEDLEYALYDVLELPKQQIDQLHYATQILWRIFLKVGKQFKHLSCDQLLALGIRREMIPYIQLDYLQQQSVLARFDFICTEDGHIKCLELNGETPFLVQETFEMNEQLCQHFSFKNPNDVTALQKTLSGALFAAMQYVNDVKKPKIVITGKMATEDYEEYCQVQFIKSCIPFEIEYVPIQKLTIFSSDTSNVSQGLYTPAMEKIDILFRPAHPAEFLIDDIASDGDRIGLQLLELVKKRQLAIINPPAAYVLQSKILLWLIWERRSDPLLFTAEERAAIQQFMLPTYLTAEPFIREDMPYVKKPVYSREGNTVEIYEGSGKKLNASQSSHYDDNLFIYQQYIEMPNITIQLKEGYQSKKWLIGSFVADNRACGLSCRVGNQITEWDSHWLAVGYKE
ncbi:glutathionylspermidine synthase family protein [Lysinibacillus irui]|uniref:Glutathionylspermidine synthase family protein n=1 Tax=Lysinibacillus irui TaxID=2998077 RepID=A0ABU5NPG5_9BACI|nr:glutathionylspermidine synthase family protein [Lysinibacillus irui]MEA0551998.1 glutathionylspermidine synthase family protein [Lysinibacillus irui]MEA0977923.1 glutathionylspermidine synthase family protein [Lysinibacillus irui]MEA1044077.1 glutathionylspermidine synthase family protein [Lysinibacillus irui]